MKNLPSQTVQSVLAARPVVSRVVGGYRLDLPRPMTEVEAFTARERAWFRKPFGAIALALALVAGMPAAHADRPVSAAVATAKHEIATGRAHLKAARDADRRAAKDSKRAAKVAKLRAALARVEGSK